jgi:RHS repeat-associated protein
MVLLAVVLAALPGRAQQPPVTPGDPRAVYIVVLNREKGAEPEFDKDGAKQLARWSNRVVVELPAPALAAMLKHGRVKYVQHLDNGLVKAATAPSPEQRVSASFVPRALTGGGTLQWSTGDYDYDGSGNIDRIGADNDGNTRRFVYDEVDRLVEAGVEAPMAAPGTYTNYSRYTYDSFGNRLSEKTPMIDATVIADKNTNRVTLPGTIVTYDGVGNMTQGGGLMYQYDPFNNLKEVDAWGGTQKMAIYNADDERIIFCGDGSTGPCRWTLRGNGNEVLREYESGPIANRSSFWSYYLWVEDSVYRGSLLAGAQREAAEGGRLHFHLDHLGSPRLTTNATGQKVTANEFAPFGRELTSITQEAQLGYDRTETHRFTGHERDFVEGTNSDTVNFIDYMHARTYTPTFGRFLSVDRKLDVEKAVHEPQMWNRYSYALNNPTNLVDRNGEEPDKTQAGTANQLVDIVRRIERANPGASPGRILTITDSYLRGHADDPGNTRYVYTAKRGWIDAKHLFAGAVTAGNIGGAQLGQAATNVLGFGLEVSQVGTPSFFSYEDLGSNAAGANFAANVFYPEGSPLSQQILNYLNSEGAVAPTAAPNWNQLPAQMNQGGSSGRPDQTSNGQSPSAQPKPLPPCASSGVSSSGGPCK